MQPLRVRHGKRAGANMLRKQPPQVARSYSEAVGERLHVAVIERPVGN